VSSPRDRFVTVYGRKPVLEVLRDPSLSIDKVLLAKGSQGGTVQAIRAAAKERGVALRVVPAADVSRVSRNGKQDQGVVCDVLAPRMGALDDWACPEQASLLALDGVTTPGNVGLILRSAVAAGVDAILLPWRGTAGLGPLVIKASAGLAFRAPILRCGDLGLALDHLRDQGFVVYGLRADGADDLWGFDLAPRAVFVLGAETAGLSDAVASRVDVGVSIPMEPEAESMNVACAATVLAYELRRRRG
jgi:23S rRNA (guanosine2251-2'-O)-methyltransferase